MTRKLLVVILLSVFSASFAQECHVADSYFIQEIIPFRQDVITRYRCWYALPFFAGYYVVDERNLMDFFKNDSVDDSKMTLLCDVHYGSMFVDEEYKKETRYFTSLLEIVYLDDNELYKIGDRLFIIRKMRYGFYDNSEKTVHVRGDYVWYMDDIQSEDIPMLESYYEVGDVYKRDYYQCLYHIFKLLPTPEKIHKRMWKYAYQITEECERDLFRPLPYEN